MWRKDLKEQCPAWISGQLVARGFKHLMFCGDPRGSCTAVGRSRDSLSLLSHQGTNGVAVVFWVVPHKIPSVVPVAATFPVVPSSAQPWPGMEADEKLGPPGTSPNPPLHQAHRVRPPAQASGTVILHFSASE